MSQRFGPSGTGRPVERRGGATVVPNHGLVGEIDGSTDKGPQPPESLADLVFRYRVTSGLDADGNSLHGQLFRNEDHVEKHPVPGVLRRLQELQLGGMGENGLGHERGTTRDGIQPLLGRYGRRLVRVS